jgi:hypothetical protein
MGSVPRSPCEDSNRQHDYSDNGERSKAHAEFSFLLLWLSVVKGTSYKLLELPNGQAGTCRGITGNEVPGCLAYLGGELIGVPLGRLGWVIVRTPDRRNRSRPYP